MPAKKQFLLRMDPQLFAQLEHWAGDEFRSVNAQIEFLLRDALKRAGRLKHEAETPKGEPAEPQD
jgi:hypothetical protein